MRTRSPCPLREAVVCEIGQAGPRMTRAIDNPILNSPYEPPERHFEIGPNGPTGEIKDGRRPSESFIPVAVTKKGKRKDGPSRRRSTSTSPASGGSRTR